MKFNFFVKTSNYGQKISKQNKYYIFNKNTYKISSKSFKKSKKSFDSNLVRTLKKPNIHIYSICLLQNSSFAAITGHNSKRLCLSHLENLRNCFTVVCEFDDKVLVSWVLKVWLHVELSWNWCFHVGLDWLLEIKDCLAPVSFSLVR